MTNKEMQVKLDENKWAESAREHCDLSGAMLYCDFCKAQHGAQCAASQGEREAGSLCAKANNRMLRRK